MYRISTCLVLIFSFSGLYSQIDSGQVNHFPQLKNIEGVAESVTNYKLTAVKISGGRCAFNSVTTTPVMVKSMFSESAFLKSDLMEINPGNVEKDANGNSKGGLPYSSDNISDYAQLNFEFGKRNNKFHGPWFTIGVNYSSNSKLFEGGVFKSSHKRFDNFYSNFGSPVSRDSFVVKSLYYKYTNNSINSEFSVVYKLVPDGIFSFSGGLGCILGGTFNNKISVTYQKNVKVVDSITVNSGEKAQYGLYQKNTAEEELKKIPSPAVNFGVFIHLALNVKLGTSNELFERTHLFAEIRPLLKNTLIDAKLKSTIAYIGCLGLSYSFR